MSGGGGGGDGEVGLQIAPLLDVLFVLLLFFMICAGSQQVEAELGIKLPSRGVARPGTPDTPINLKIDEIGQAFIEGKAIDTPKSHDMPQLKARLTDAVAKYTDKQPVIVTPAPKTKHERVMDVLNACNAAKIKNLAFGVSPN